MPSSYRRLQPLALAAFLIAATASTASLSYAAPQKPTTTGKNAFTVLTAAVAGIKDGKKIDYAVARSHDTAADPNNREYSAAEMAKLVDENRGILTQARSALILPYVPPPANTPGVKFPYLTKLREIARLFLLEAMVEESQGKWAAAMNSRLDAVALGEKIQANTVMMGALVGVACEAIGMRSEWDNVEHLNAAESKTAARRLEALIAGHPPLMNTFRNEVRLQRLGLSGFYQSTDPVSYLKSGGAEITEDEAPMIGNAHAELHRAGLDTAFCDFDNAVAVSLTRVSGIWQAPSGPESRPGKLMVTRLFLSPISPKFRFKVLLGETQARLLLTNLAIRAYRLDNGKYPDSLKDLCPKYLKAPPSDLFSDNQPLKYGHIGESPLIYSIGPDGVDDSGQPILSADAKDDASRYFVLYESEGDIVGGTNT